MWIKQDNTIQFTASDIQTMDKIPVGVWLMKFSPEKGYYLEQTQDFKFPKKIYGDSEAIAARYLNTFANQSTNLGILLTGLKGTGKSVTAKLVCAKSNLPVILITEPFHGDGFKSFLANITQEVVVFIDEFEKVYYEVAYQYAFLSILDGIFTGKKLFLFTSNEKGNINQYMINRPGRVHYLKEYSALDDSIISDVIDDNLENKDNKPGLLEVLNILGSITMDVLMSLIKEMNLYKETARQSVRFLNMRPDKQSYDVVAFHDNVRLGSTSVSRHPLTTQTVSVELYASDLTRYKRGATNHDSIMWEINEYRSRIGLKPLPILKSDVPGNDDDELFNSSAGEMGGEETSYDAAQLPAKAYEYRPEAVAVGEPSPEEPLTEQEPVAIARDVQIPSGRVYFSLDTSNAKTTVKTEGGKITINDGFGNRFEFTKSEPFYFAF